MRRTRSIASAVLLLLVARGMTAFAAEYSADVVVYGATATGAIAAVAAAREGATVLLIEPGRHVGGMVSGGLGATDVGKKDTVGGYSREFFQRLGAKYGQSEPAWTHEPHVAEQVFNDMLGEAKVKVLRGQRLVERTGVTKEKSRITGVRTEAGDTFVGRVYIDATYEGDLMAQAKVAYAVGRESVEQYGESRAGVRRIVPFNKAGSAYDEKGLLPDIDTAPLGPPGSADQRIMSYTYRLCLTNVPANRIKISRPEAYDPRQYALLLEDIARKPTITFGDIVRLNPIPNGKVDLNNRPGLITSLNLHNGSWAYPNASYTERAAISEKHKTYVAGLLFFLANDTRVPAAVRAEANEWGLARDEFADTGNWPHQLYVRVGRRMVGDYVMTEHDALTTTTKPDGVALGSYFLDSHRTLRTVLPNGDVATEGGVGGATKPYEIAYRSLTPKAGECENLLVPLCMSASGVAWCSIRMEPVLMMLGHAAGDAAAMSAKSGTAVQSIDVASLRKHLTDQKSVLRSPAARDSKGEAKGDAAPQVVPLVVADAASKMLSKKVKTKPAADIVIDDLDMQFAGGWTVGSDAAALGGQRLLHDNDGGKGTIFGKFTPDLPGAGRYAVRVRYLAAPNRSRATPITVQSTAGRQTFLIDQTQRPIEKGGWLTLGTFDFAAGTSGWVAIANAGTKGVVNIDAVLFAPATTDEPGPAPATNYQAADFDRVKWRGRLIGMKGQPADGDVREPLLPCFDSYGQWMHRDWPGKIQNDGELAAERQREAQTLAAMPGPADWDAYGGWAAGPKRLATGFFRTEKIKDRWWLIDPDGRLFFSTGVNSVRKMDATPVERRESMFAGRPWDQPAFAPFISSSIKSVKYDFAGTTPRSFNFTWANLFRKYGPAWQVESSLAAHRRLRSWGFNTLGNWSDEGTYLLRKTPYTVNVSASGLPLAGNPRFSDPFDGTLAINFAARVAQESGKSLNDPWCIGYFVDNELPWREEFSVGVWTLMSPATQPAKHAMVGDLQPRYGTIEKLNAAWGSRFDSWEALLASKNEPPENKAAREDQVAFHYRFAEQYYATIQKVMKQAAPNQLYLGSRIHTKNAGARAAAAKHVDVMSYNTYRSTPDTLDDFDVPMLVSEFGVGAPDRGMFYGGIHSVATQQDRAAHFTRFMDAALANPRVVGVHWFQYSDQPASGRVLEGENGQYGIVDLCDTAYAEVIDAARAFASRLYERRGK